MCQSEPPPMGKIHFFLENIVIVPMRVETPRITYSGEVAFVVRSQIKPRLIMISKERSQ